MLGFYNYTVIATYCGLISAVVGIIKAANGRPDLAIICLLLSGFFDMFDGTIARTKKTRTAEESRFGIQIDSLTDLVAFGVLPSIICMRVLETQQMRISSVVVASVYVLTALIRLAYYNVTEEIRQDQTSEKRRFFMGLPVTSSAVIFPLLWCFKPILGSYFALATLVSVLLTAALFILPIKIPKPGGRVMAALCVIGAGVFAVLMDEFSRGRLL